MWLILLIVILVLLFGGGAGFYRGYGGWGYGYPVGGILWVILIIILIFWLVGRL